jgi:hypothetical protein
MKRTRLSLLEILFTCIVVLICPAAAYIVLDIDVTDSQDPVMASTSYKYYLVYVKHNGRGGCKDYRSTSS